MVSQKNQSVMLCCTKWLFAPLQDVCFFNSHFFVLVILFPSNYWVLRAKHNFWGRIGGPQTKTSSGKGPKTPYRGFRSHWACGAVHIVKLECSSPESPNLFGRTHLETFYPKNAYLGWKIGPLPAISKSGQAIMRVNNLASLEARQVRNSAQSACDPRLG